MNKTAKNAKCAKEIHCYFLLDLAHLAFLAVQIVRCSKTFIQLKEYWYQLGRAPR